VPGPSAWPWGADLIARLAARQPAWAVNGLACAAMAELLAPVDLARWAKETARLRDQLVSTLADHDLRAEPSDANWVLVHSPGLRDRLAAQAVLVRDCANFAMVDTVRIAVPDDRGLDRLEVALCRA
ncbi:MAG: hypothetical protein M3N98_15800, partial [Actinomycetota bacterium]|nr:hypothetical protein [Actinomycetota bacterium]